MLTFVYKVGGWVLAKAYVRGVHFTMSAIFPDFFSSLPISGVYSIVMSRIFDDVSKRYSLGIICTKMSHSSNQSINEKLHFEQKCS